MAVVLVRGRGWVIQWTCGGSCGCSGLEPGRDRCVPCVQNGQVVFLTQSETTAGFSGGWRDVAIKQVRPPPVPACAPPASATVRHVVSSRLASAGRLAFDLTPSASRFLAAIVYTTPCQQTPVHFRSTRAPPLWQVHAFDRVTRPCCRVLPCRPAGLC